MDVKEREKFYDQKIAPELLRLGKMCLDNGLSFVCGVEWEPDEVGRTACLQADAGEGLRKANRVLQGEGLGNFLAMTITTKKESDNG